MKQEYVQITTRWSTYTGCLGIIVKKVNSKQINVDDDAYLICFGDTQILGKTVLWFTRNEFEFLTEREYQTKKVLENLG